MELLKLAAASLAVAGVGCYAPELRDCTVTCNAASDCASGQVCGTDHFCAAPDIAGQCSSLPSDASPGGRDAGVADAKMVDAKPDAASPPDAATHAMLAIQIEGKGRVSIVGVGTCDEASPQNGSCMFVVPRNLTITVTATAYPDWRFDRWTTAACAVVEINTCSFTPKTDTPVGVKFRNTNGNGNDD